ncbi:MAG TPA: ribonuclease Y [Ktedonobacterales bacterium]|nr:ribonuclease Y [Ktedonobacterales bacterium]
MNPWEVVLIGTFGVVSLGLGILIGLLLTRSRHSEELRQEKESFEARLVALQQEQAAALREQKEESARTRAAIETEVRERRAEIKRQEQRLNQKEEALDRKTDALERREHQLAERTAEVESLKAQLEDLRSRRVLALEQAAQMTQQQAREELIQAVEETAQRDATRRSREIEARARDEAEARAREIITLAIQRCASDQVSDVTISVVPLPNDEMKGRIIGREGRNIRALEAATGVDLIIDDTPEAVILSGFDPVRREIARIALTRLIIDGRIHPARIEEVVAKAQQEIENVVREEGERACAEANVSNLPPELVKLIGRLHFRSSYGQNVLNHSIEVSVLAATIAAELGADVGVCKVAGLLHDLGKAIDQEVEGPHMLISGEIARRFNRSPKIIHAIVAHHATDTEPQSLEAAIVQAADAISAARPGARRETIDLYIRRLETLESIANSFTGVEKSFAIQAGREVRIIVKPEEVDEIAAHHLAREVARKIEENMDYPGQIKVCVVRETRSVDYAK